MERLPDPRSPEVRAAEEYLRLGYRPIPLRPGTKAAAVKWKEFQSRPPTREEVAFWFGKTANIALVTGSGVAVVDVDDPALMDEVLARCGETPMQTRTPRGGVHLWYAMKPGVHYGSGVRLRDQPLDLRAEGAYAAVPWSRDSTGVPYLWLGDVVPPEKLPPLKIGWLRERMRPEPQRPLMDPGEDIGRLVRRARAYLATIEGAIAGQRGHDRTYRAACILCVKFGLGFDEAFPLLKEWSETSCEPPWSDMELEHKVRDALKNRDTLPPRRS